MLADLSPDEIVELGFDERTGDVVRQETYADPRVLTGTELLRQFFDIDAIYPNPDPDAVLLRDYLFLARNPMRTDKDEQMLETMRTLLELAGIDPKCEPVARIGDYVAQVIRTLRQDECLAPVPYTEPEQLKAAP